MSTIITTAELTSYLIDQELNAGLAALVVAAANEYVESATGRAFGAVQTETDELHDYAPVIFLRHQDVATVTAVKRGRTTQTVVPATSYFFNSLGRLELSTSRMGFNPQRDYVRVSYTHGKTSVPADLKLAALSLASDFYSFAEDGNQEVTSEGIGSMRLTYAKGQDSSTGKSYFKIIDRYRTLHV